MKRIEKLKDNALNMKDEYQISHRKICRKIDTIFNDEIQHFKNLFIEFNKTHKCVMENEIDYIIGCIQNVFNDSKVILVENYQGRFDKNLDGLVSTMYDFFVRKINNPLAKMPTKEMDRYLAALCRFECFIVENKLEDALMDFSDDFIYRYINSDDGKRDFDHMIKNLNHSVICELKKAIADSIQDKQEIVMRYNRLNKEILLQKEEFR